MKKVLLIVLPLMLFLQARANVKLPSIISNNMVLQQQGKVALWGWALPGEKISILTSWNQRTAKVTAGADGKWITYVKTSKAGGPYYIKFTGNNEIKVENVLLGEVWLASGQSNMEFFMAKTKNVSYTGVLNYEEEIKKADYFGIRMIDVANKVADVPQYEFEGSWKVCSPATADTFSGVAYYFAKEVHVKTGFPVGIINATWGGTPAESWTKKEVLEKDKDFKVILDRYEQQVKDFPTASAEYKEALAKWKSDSSKNRGAAPREPIGPNHNKSPYKLYNGMISPIVPYTLKGVIWYQGENNAEHAYQYRRLFPAMIENWRDDFKNNALPFYFVQISPHRSQNPEIREAQLLTFQHVAHTGMAVTTDNGDSLDIHPRNKKLVGERLSLWALHNNYGFKDITCSGPIYRSMKVEGKKIRIQFDYVDGGLVAKGDAALQEFTIAGSDEKFVPAQAVIEGNEVVVWSDAIDKPVAVRFAWRNVPMPNLYNKSFLPASPFRTDNWKGITEGKN
ncbi:sialate O-acetylesterase [Filimonas lacunae]|uniref:Sialate O-acetylesterase n=1 Tax=Filimonas lacunae TaxID=477680 RepID=A0A173MMK0_9BACT|nr:sialate O-acetylesterase [Filimonas lacunae]BAV08862.1 sialic acid-specific 9-O-acetylesterase [Filimonas lacunae]SIS62971.1 sialate O-acetylesterase [Filimonas lacunae]